jgi:hypothetical protein
MGLLHFYTHVSHPDVAALFLFSFLEMNGSFLTTIRQQTDVADNILLFFYKKKRKENKKNNKILPATSACCWAVVRNEWKDHFSFFLLFSSLESHPIQNQNHPPRRYPTRTIPAPPTPATHTGAAHPGTSRHCPPRTTPAPQITHHPSSGSDPCVEKNPVPDPPRRLKPTVVPRGPSAPLDPADLITRVVGKLSTPGSKTHPPSKIRKHTHQRRASPRQMQPERRRRNRDDEIQTPKIAGSESSDGHSDGDAHRFQRRKPKKKKEKYVM